METLKICIGTTIRIGREIQCLPYAGFLMFSVFSLVFRVFSFVF